MIIKRLYDSLSLSLWDQRLSRSLDSSLWRTDVPVVAVATGVLGRTATGRNRPDYNGRRWISWVSSLASLILRGDVDGFFLLKLCFACSNNPFVFIPFFLFLRFNFSRNEIRSHASFDLSSRGLWVKRRRLQPGVEKLLCDQTLISASRPEDPLIFQINANNLKWWIIAPVSKFNYC